MTELPLPYDCDWIVEGALCALSLPDRATLDHLQKLGVSLVVSVASEDYADEIGEWCRLSGMRWLRYHVRDMRPPRLEDVRDFVAEVAAEISRGGRAAVHCLGGVGRTGTMVACYLVSQGFSAAQAIEAVRLRRPGSVQTLEQELAVEEYADELGRKP